MKKTYLFWFAILAFLFLGCRSDNFNPNETSNQQALKFRVVPKSSIPRVINELQAKTANFTVSLKALSASGKSETIFGEVKTDFVVETINDGSIYYNFPVVPADSTQDIYNLEVKESDGTYATIIVRYSPSEDWLTNHPNDFLLFSGNISTYTLDGTQQTSMSMVNGSGGCSGNPGGGGGPSGPGGTNGPGDTGGGGGGNWPNTGGDGGTTGGGTGTGGNGCGNYQFSHYSYFQNPVTGERYITGEVWINLCGETQHVFYGGSNKGNCNGVGSGTVSIPLLNDPCKKTKAMIEKADVKPKLNELYEKSKTGGEKAFLMKNDGTAGNIIEGGEHSVKFDMTGNKGVYHNHTPTGIKIVSVQDIHTLFNFIINQPAGTPMTDVFVGMVGSEPCAVAGDCPTDGYEYFNYVVRFSGTAQQATDVYNHNKDLLAKLSLDYKEFENSVRNKSGYSSQYGNYISNKGLEELFYYTIGKMGIDKSKMMLQRIDKNGNVINVTLGTDGKPKDAPCT